MPELLRPEPLSPDPSIPRIDGNVKYREVEEKLSQGRRLCVSDTYGTALTLYSWLKKSLQRRFPVRDYRTSRLFRERFWHLSRPLLVPVVDHRIALRKAPSIPWLERLYPDERDFLLPLADLLGLNGSWQWYHNGVQYPILDHLLHPFYGVSFSTRCEHLELFDAWLASSERTFAEAIDVGVGAGALTFLLIKHGVPCIHATDTNPNAIYSVGEDLAKLGLQDRVVLEISDLFGAGPPVDLIAFNPPWLPGVARVSVDRGSYYADDLFPRFFQAAVERLKPGGRLVLLFSNFAQIAGLTAEHPVVRELEEQNRFRLVVSQKKKVSPPSHRREDWLHQLRRRERVQLWELAPDESQP